MNAFKAQQQSERSAVAQIVQQRDRDRYICALFAPKQQRYHLLSLYAFHSEILRIPAMVSEPTLGEIRLQWWRDALSSSNAETKSGNPVADAVRQTIDTHTLPPQTFLEIIDTACDDLYERSPGRTLDRIEDASKTDAAIFSLAATILDPKNDGPKCAFHAGTAWYLIRVLRFQSCGSHQPETPSAKELREFVEKAFGHFHAEQHEISRKQWPAFLPMALVSPYLESFARQARLISGEPVMLNPLKRFWRVWRAAVVGKI